MTIPKVEVPANKVIKIIRVEGGNKLAICLSCKAKGWLIWSYGYPAHSTTGISSELTHKDDCPMNEVLDDEGNIIED